MLGEQPSNRATERKNGEPTERISSGVTIEPLREGEIGAFRDIILNGIRSVHEPADEYSQREITERTEAYYQGLLANPDDWLLLAAKDTSGAIVGGIEMSMREVTPETTFIKYMDSPEEIAQMVGSRVGYSYWLCVAPESQQKGIAAQLYRENEPHLRQRGISRIVAYIDAGNEASLRLHRRAGITDVLAVDFSRGREWGKWYGKKI